MSDIGFYKRLAEQRKNTALELYSKLDALKQQRNDLRDNLQAIVDNATEQVKEGMVSFKQTSVLIKLKLITNAKTAIAKCEV